jgi:hypothetical protein
MAAFSVSPARAVNGLINFASSEGIKIYNKGSSRLMEAEYEMEPDLAFNLIENLELRGHTFGWTEDPEGVTYIPEDPDAVDLDQEELTYLFDKFGSIDLIRIQQWEKRIYVDEERAAQDSNMIFNAIMSTLSEDAKALIFLHKADYEFTAANGSVIQGGLALFKVVMTESTLEGKGIASHIRGQINSLKDYIPQVNSDIEKFNSHAKLLMRKLNRLGESTNDDDYMSSLMDSYGVTG